MTRNILLMVFLTISFSINGYSQTYKTYDQALEAFKSYAKTKGFKAVENKYDHCKHMKSAVLRKTDEEVNAFTQRMDLKVTYDYKYVGCYVGWDKYTGSAKVTGYITQTENGRYKYGYKGAEVLHWDPDD